MVSPSGPASGDLENSKMENARSEGMVESAHITLLTWILVLSGLVFNHL